MCANSTLLDSEDTLGRVELHNNTRITQTQMRQLIHAPKDKYRTTTFN